MTAVLAVFLLTGCYFQIQSFESYSVIYSADKSDGGAVPSDTASYSDGATVTLAGPGTMTRTGYVFKGWNTLADGNGTSYAAGAKVVIKGSDLKLYAQWEAEAPAPDPTPEPEPEPEFPEYSVGDAGPAGGIVIYAKDAASDGWQYIEAAPKETEGPAKTWGHDGESMIAVDRGIGSGKANTEKLHSSDAAKACTDLDYGGFSDWFLPSAAELEAMNTALASTAEAIPEGEKYWSSTEFYDSMMPDSWGTSAEALNADPGAVGCVSYYSRNYTCNVRAIRYF